MTNPGKAPRIGRKECIGRAVIGMLVDHPELVPRKPGRAEWSSSRPGWPRCGLTASTRRSWPKSGGGTGRPEFKA